MQVRMLDVDGKTLATLTLREGRVVLQGTLAPRVKQQLAMLSHEAGSPKKFLQRLPAEFSGTYLRAELVES